MKVEVLTDVNRVKFRHLVGGQGFITQTNHLYVKMTGTICGYNAIRVKSDNGEYSFAPYWINDDLDVYPRVLNIVTN